MHWFVTTGGWPGPTFLHVPTLFMMLHATQVVLQAVSQQTPWGEQKVDTHSGPMVHGWKSVPSGVQPAEPQRASTILALVLLGVAAAAVYALVVVYPR